MVLALDVGGTAIKGEVLTAGHRALVTGRCPTPVGAADGRAVLDAAAALGRELLAGVGSGAAVAAVGVGVPGLVDAARGVGVRSTNLGWRDAPVAAHLVEALGLPVAVRHDVAAAGRAEFRLGAGRGASDVLFVVIGTGIAAAVLAGGRPVAGGLGQAGELGHVRVRSDGPPCRCGARGCLEALASAAAIGRAYTARTGRTVTGAADVLARLDTDADARAVWDDAVTALADGLLVAQGVLAPSRVVLGGGLAAAGAALLDPLAAALRERATVQAVPDLRLARLGERAGVIGAGLAARDLR